MLRGRLPAAAAVVAVLAFPAVSLADSAGDNQYQDPFSNVPAQPKKQKSSTTTTPAPAPSPAPAATTSTPSATPTATVAAPSSTSSTRELPRTGFPVLPVTAIGVALIAAGLGLRRLASDR